MPDFIMDYIAKWMIIASAAIYYQVSIATDGIVSRGFDQGFSIGLLIIGILAVVWHYYNDRKYLREVIDNLSKNNDQKDARFVTMMEESLSASRNLTESLRELTRTVQNNNNNARNSM